MSVPKSAWSRLPLDIDAIVVGIKETICKGVGHCRLSCADSSTGCSGHLCGDACNTQEYKKLEDLIKSCVAEMEQESDLSYSKFVLEKLVLKTLQKLRAGFKKHCEGTFCCSLRCLGCAGHRDCFRGYHAYNCLLSNMFNCQRQCSRNHVCGYTSPNLKIVAELESLKADVAELLQKPFGPDVAGLQLTLGPEDSASQAPKRKTVPSEADPGGKKARVGIVDNMSESASVNLYASIVGSESWISADGGPRCFLADMLFQMTTEPPSFSAAKDLRPGFLVVAADGETILEVTNVKEDETSKLIELHAEDSAPFKTTASHRVMVPAYAAKPIAIRAGDVKENDFVLCTRNLAKKVMKVKFLEEHAAIFAISFKPDEPVAAFMPPSSVVLTKGLTSKPTRRGGMKKKVMNTEGPDCDGMSVNTEGEYMD